MENKRKLAIVGAGGFGRETLCCWIDILRAENKPMEDTVVFLVQDEYYKETRVMGVEVLPVSAFDSSLYKVVVAIGDPKTRKKVVESLPENTIYTSLIHPTAVVSDFVEIGEGTIITAGSIITCGIKIGKHAHVNLHTTIGHDCVIGDYLTTAPGVNISGNCSIGETVYIGTNAALRDTIRVTDRVVIGMGGIVVKPIEEEGVYVGNPLRKIS